MKLSEYKSYDMAAHQLYTEQILREVLLGLHSLCMGADAPFFLLTLRQYGLQLAAALALCTPIGKRLLEQLEGSTAGRWVKLVLLGAVFALSLLAMTGSTMQAFIYAQF